VDAARRIARWIAHLMVLLRLLLVLVYFRQPCCSFKKFVVDPWSLVLGKSRRAS
jgi:hypothetical protein